MFHRKQTLVNVPQEDYITDMCRVQHGIKRRLCLSHYYSGSVAQYNIKTSAVQWTSGNKPRGIHACGITANQRGHMFVCDIINACVHMFELNGRYMGVLLTEGEQGLGQPQWAWWCNDTSCLIVTHIKNTKCSLSAVKF